MNFESMGFIKKDLEKLTYWCKTQTPTMIPTVSNYTVGIRREKWGRKRV